MKKEATDQPLGFSTASYRLDEISFDDITDGDVIEDVDVKFALIDDAHLVHGFASVEDIMKFAIFLDNTSMSCRIQ